MNTPINLTFDIESSNEEFRNQVIGSTECFKRSKLTCATDNYLTKLIQNAEIGVKCVLRNCGKSFKKAGSRKKTGPVFNGLFKCKLKTCQIKFRIVLQVRLLNLILINIV
jgi:hypothetical protein